MSDEKGNERRFGNWNEFLTEQKAVTERRRQWPFMVDTTRPQHVADVMITLDRPEPDPDTPVTVTQLKPRNTEQPGSEAGDIAFGMQVMQQGAGIAGVLAEIEGQTLYEQYVQKRLREVDDETAFPLMGALPQWKSLNSNQQKFWQDLALNFLKVAA